MKPCIVVAILSLTFVTAASCNDMNSVVDYKNQTLESFWTSYSLEDRSFSPYRAGGILVLMGWPQAGYQHYDAALAVVAPSPGAEVEVLRLEVRHLGLVPLQDAGEVIKIDRKVEGRALYRADRKIALMIDAEKLAQAVAASGGKLETVLSVRIHQGGVEVSRDIAYSFDRKVRKYLPIR